MLESQLSAALDALVDAGEFALGDMPDIPLERSRGGDHGDFACPIALSLARSLKRNPRQIAEAIVARLPGDDAIERVEIAGPGFINFFLRSGAMSEVVRTVHEGGADYGRSSAGAGTRVQVEFVSANPTGPLHVGHGRGAAYGAAVANLLDAVGYEVQREYYVNDAGRQMDILAVSVWIRYLQQLEEEVPFPAKGYRGDYVGEMAAELAGRDGRKWRCDGGEVSADLPADDDEQHQEAHIDALIARARSLLGDGYDHVFQHALGTQVEDIRSDLEEFGVRFDRWFSERSLADAGTVDACIKQLEDTGHVYKKDRTRWFRSTEFGDEKDRVVVRDNGVPTYFASDIAYVKDKFARGFDHVIYVWGADHHGYIARLNAAASALGLDSSCIEIPLVQFAQLYRGGEKVQMSTRSGQFVTLRELRAEVGRDAARFFYVMRRAEQHLDFDLDLAKSQRNDNPVHYVHYAHARIASTLERAQERGMAADFEAGLSHLDRLTLAQEQAMMGSIARFPEAVLAAAEAREPHQITFYLRELANELHGYYNLDGMRLLDEDAELRNARLALCQALRIVLANGLALLGVSAPDRM